MNNFGLLVFRVMLGSFMLFGHGMGKLTHFGEYAQRFPDVTGIGATFSLTVAVFAEVFCSAAIIVGFATRLAALPLLATMAVAGLYVHAQDGFAKQEMALLYLAGWILLFCTGAGSWSIDGLLKTDGFLRRR